MTLQQTSQGEAFYDFSINFQEFVKSVVGHDRVYYAMTNFARPKEQYVTYRPRITNPMDRGSFRRFDSDGNSIYSLNYIIDVEVSCYKEFYDVNAPDPSLIIPILPQDVISAIMHRIENKGVAYKYFWQNGAGHHKNSVVEDRPVPLDGVNWEQRSVGTMTFHMIIEDVRTDEPFDQDIDGFIQTVIFDSTGHDGSTTITCEDEVVSYPPRGPSDPIIPAPP